MKVGEKKERAYIYERLTILSFNLQSRHVRALPAEPIYHFSVGLFFSSRHRARRGSTYFFFFYFEREFFNRANDVGDSAELPVEARAFVDCGLILRSVFMYLNEIVWESSRCNALR